VLFYLFGVGQNGGQTGRPEVWESCRQSEGKIKGGGKTKKQENRTSPSEPRLLGEWVTAREKGRGKGEGEATSKPGGGGEQRNS